MILVLIVFCIPGGAGHVDRVGRMRTLHGQGHRARGHRVDRAVAGRRRQHRGPRHGADHRAGRALKTGGLKFL